MGSGHTTLELHTEVRWSSREKELKRIFELKDEIRERVGYDLFVNDECVCKSDIFVRWYELYRKNTSRNEYILTSMDIEGFVNKPSLWIQVIENGSFEMLPIPDGNKIVMNI